MRFRPCIDLHSGVVKQIVGSTLRDGAAPTENFVSEAPPAHFAGLFRRDGLRGGHVVMLGPGNERAATEALAAYPGGLQIGGGIDPSSARGWLERGASAVIATSFLFEAGELAPERLETLVAAVGAERLVLDLSCGRRDERFFVKANRWQHFTRLELNAATLASLAQHCAEFLIHAVDVEGLQRGPDRALIELLADAAPIPTTYAGGIASRRDVELLADAGRGRLDFTVGSALDLFGGSGLRYADLAREFGAP